MSPTNGDELRERGRKTITEMFSLIDGVTVDDLKTEGVTLRSGNKILKLEVVSEETHPIEDEIREEVRIKLAEKMAEVKENLNRRINDMMNNTRAVKDEAEAQVRKYKTKLNNIHAMPDVSFDLAKMGLSVAKGTGDELVWLVRGVYWPKYCVNFSDDYKQIEPRYAKKMMSEVVFLIRTSGKKVLSVSTRKPIGLGKFHHYHQREQAGSTDCWGKWHFKKTWSTPKDILKIGKEAEAVLETVNLLSMATDNPASLPQKVNLEQHLLNEPVKIGRVDSKASRMGVTAGQRNDNVNQEVWTA